MTLSSKFVDYEVCHATGIAKDIVESCYNFCVENIIGFETCGIADDMIAVMHDEMEPENVPYFTYEALQYFMNDFAPVDCYFGNHPGDGTMGYWKITDDDMVDYESHLMQNSNIITKLVFIAENGQSGKLRVTHSDALDELAWSIIELDHAVTFGQCVDKTQNFNPNTMVEYLCDDCNLFKWVIEQVYWSDFKAQIDQFIGSQDITCLFLDILITGRDKIDGIKSDDVWSLRESCSECKSFDTDCDDCDNLDCGCVGYEELNNVWIVNESSFYDELKAWGAMVYETDSLYLYLQTNHTGNYYDPRLRLAWMTYGSAAWLGRLL